ncbi:unnamed protein product (macronuclear) [Paramecium tetraurelia]|uniref:Uncharacterized protein n=1 Tax=Paramecium tetraurelia TaxID=5888 RepID=A0DSQ7_PARTE|nr:uncharacterized protein GSPATT00019767001 [Paramecium tetraurelia]CAK86074.1 unnamed protein product [Paramecium tetraurelia]|eukprot:XP_001453471.1 hypothetical protein (macronuclear) [Paramecium tetraurelia strain d4-2]
MSSQESDSEYQEFVTTFYHLVQDINEYCATKSKEGRTARFLKQAKARRKVNQVIFRMPENPDQNVSEIISYNKNQAEKLVKPMRHQTKNLENSQVEPYISNVHLILRQIQIQYSRDLKLKQQILRNAQKQVYLNLIEQYKQKSKKSQPRNCCLHIYLAEKIYQEKMKETATCLKFHEGPKIVIPLFKNTAQTRKGSME